MWMTSYQFPMTMREIIPENIKSLELNAHPASSAQAFYTAVQMTITLGITTKLATI